MASWRTFLALLVLSIAARAQGLDSLRDGHWVELKGRLDAEQRFVVTSLEVEPPAESEELLGEVSAIDKAAGTFTLLGRTLAVSSRTRWEGLGFDDLPGRRVRAQLHWRGAGRFETRQVYARGEGRDRLVGRIEELRVETDGARSARVMDFRVWFPPAAKLENTTPLAGFALAPQRVAFEPQSAPGDKDLEDTVAGTHRLGRDLWLGFLFEDQSWQEQDYDLDSATQKDRTRHRISLRAQLHWTPSDSFEALASPRYEWDARYAESGSNERLGKLHWNEAWIAVHDVFAKGLSLYAGRQLFDDEREWIYKANLDAVRAVWAGTSARLELSASRMFRDGSDFDLHADNLIGYLSNTDPKRHVALWFVDRRDDREPREYPFCFGLRALGDFLPRTDCWFELSGVRGYANQVNLRGWGYDAGLTWKPTFLAPVYLGFGHAFGSGDDRSTPLADESFRQSGLQKNNGRFGGVANFRYYGELFDPELSNLSITTIDLGVRAWKRASLDLVWHEYREVELSTALRNTNLRSDPDGLHRLVA